MVKRLNHLNGKLSLSGLRTLYDKALECSNCMNMVSIRATKSTNIDGSLTSN